MAQFVPIADEELVERLITYFVGTAPGVTDFNSGSVIRTLLEAFALELARQNLAFEIGINEAVEQSAYTTFGFNRQAAGFAYGRVLFTRTPDASATTPTLVPAGTVVTVSSAPSLRFETTTDLVLSVDAPTGLVTVQAAAPGALYNVLAGQIDTLFTENSDIASVTNPHAFITGTNPEDDLQRRERFAQFLVGLHRSTRSAVLFGVQSAQLLDDNGYVVERVQKASTIEESPGTIWVYIHNGVSNTSPALVAQAQQVLAGYRDANGVHEGWKAAGIRSVVFAATETPVNVDCQIEIEDGFLGDIVAATVQQAIVDFIADLDIGDTLRLESLKQVIRRTAGVLDIVAVALPQTNVTALVSEILVRGSVRVLWSDNAGNTGDQVIGE